MTIASSYHGRFADAVAHRFDACVERQQVELEGDVVDDDGGPIGDLLDVGDSSVGIDWPIRRVADRGDDLIDGCRRFFERRSLLLSAIGERYGALGHLTGHFPGWQTMSCGSRQGFA